MAFSVSTISGWINENSQNLIESAIMESNTVQAVTVMPGVKYISAIKYLSGNALIQAAACGTPTSSGTTTITDKDIRVYDFMVYEELCPQDFDDTSLQMSMKPGWNTEIPFEQQYAQMKVKNLQDAIELQIWANQASGTTTIQGLIAMAEDDSDVNDRTFVWSGSTYTAENYDTEVWGMLNDLTAAVPAVATDNNLTLFVPPEVSRKMTQAQVTANRFHSDFTTTPGLEPWLYPGTNITVYPTSGLRSTNAVFLTPAWNIIVATDLQGEYEQFKLWFSEDDNIVKFRQQFKLGVSYYFGTYIVLSNA
jgi:hypothetical protein